MTNEQFNAITLYAITRFGVLLVVANFNYVGVEMKIITTLGEVISKTNDWIKFCDEFGWDEYAVKNGGGDTEITLTLDEAKKYKLLED